MHQLSSAMKQSAVHLACVAAAFTGFASLSACNAEPNSPGNPGPPSANAGAGASGGGASNLGNPSTAGLPKGGPGRVMVHRLNITEYNNTVHDLFGTNLKLADDFPPDDTAYGFDNIASALSITDSAIGYYFDTAKKIVSEALTPTNRTRLVSCDVASGKETCVGSAVGTFLPRAWRRPVQPDEVAKLVALYTNSKTDGSTDDDALGRVFQAILLSPEFLYRIEHNSGQAATRPLDGYELASRLSYFLWSSMPDADLTTAAASGTLTQPEGLSTQVARLLKDQRASALAANFGSQWLGVRGLANVHPDTTVFPMFDEDLRAAMRDESVRLFNDVAIGARPLSELLTGGSGYVNDRLAKHYGMAAVGSTTPVFVPLPPERAGLLGQASIMTVLAHPNETAPVLRGKWLLSQLLCRELPPPPPGVPQEPAPAMGQSRKQRLAGHRIDPTCRTCHDQMDPPGLALENYDGVGQYRTTDSGVPIDASGSFPDGTTFQNAKELAALIAKDPALPRCVATHLFTYGLGRAPRTDVAYDLDTITAITTSFASAGQMFPKLVEALVTSDVFRNREDEAAQ